MGGERKSNRLARGLLSYVRFLKRARDRGGLETGGEKRGTPSSIPLRRGRPSEGGKRDWGGLEKKKKKKKKNNS